MKMTKEEYQRYVARKAQKSPIVKDTACAFLIGGGICVIGQAILNLAKGQGLDQTAAGTADIMSHIMEAYFSNIEGYLQDRMAEGLLTMLNGHLFKGLWQIIKNIGQR